MSATSDRELLDHLHAATEGLTLDERHAANAHLLGGLLQLIESGDPSKANALRTIDAALAYATQDRASS